MPCAARAGSCDCNSTSCALQNGHQAALRWTTIIARLPARAAVKLTGVPCWSRRVKSGNGVPIAGPVGNDVGELAMDGVLSRWRGWLHAGMRRRATDESLAHSDRASTASAPRQFGGAATVAYHARAPVLAEGERSDAPEQCHGSRPTGTVKLSLLGADGGPKVGNERRIGDRIRPVQALAPARTGSVWGGFVQSKLNVTVPQAEPIVGR